MGKRIPKSSKHKKLKFVDPCYKGSNPLVNKRKLLYNEPPRAEADEQEMNDFIIVKNNIIEKDQPGMERKVKPMPAVVKQKKFESENQFMNRLQRMADIAIAEAKVEEKYNIELVNVDKKGNAQYVAASKEVTEKKKEKRKHLKERKKEKKRMKMDDKEFDLKKETISFGEVASAPPVLTGKLRKAPELTKAGNRELLLKSMLPSNPGLVENKVAPLSTKWKHMLPDKRKTMESERLRAVEMYRLLKSKKAS
ncbi:uncharacterized protein CDAR_598131 [Caerostris darwini]|uniref:Coiled-coil domain-containing protein 137 n=1 Tax=Caerostris darwini TaxID=1538125 RepID=A0AAV4QHN9_9ARAC|nr:uncharacterized protein CDAR_598131 [Caerostris darwini]